jgi:hypothetical protein
MNLLTCFLFGSGVNQSSWSRPVFCLYNVCFIFRLIGNLVILWIMWVEEKTDSKCRWKLRMYSISSCGQPTEGGPLARVSGGGLTTFPRKTVTCYEMFLRVWKFDGFFGKIRESSDVSCDTYGVVTVQYDDSCRTKRYEWTDRRTGRFTGAWTNVDDDYDARSGR